MGQVTTQHAGERESGIERLQRVAAASPPRRSPVLRLPARLLPRAARLRSRRARRRRPVRRRPGPPQPRPCATAGRDADPRAARRTAIRDGWSSDRSIVLLVTDDAPFLVDTVRIVLERHGVATHLLVHPMLHVRRTRRRRADRGRRGVPVPTRSSRRGRRSRSTACEGDRTEALAADLRAAVELVHRVVADFAAMRDRMLALADIDPLLRWLADGQFVFLGAATYDTTPEVAVRPGSTLGQLDESSPLDPALRLDAEPVSIARSVGRASIHRAARMTVVSVQHADADGKPVVDRFVGLLASTAYRQSVLSIPSVGDRARAVLGLAPSRGRDPHRALDAQRARDAPARPRVRARRPRAGRARDRRRRPPGAPDRPRVRRARNRSATARPCSSSCPGSASTPACPSRSPSWWARRTGRPPTEIDSFLGSSNLARITFTVTRTEGAEPDLDHVSALVDDLTTSWTDRLQACAVDQLGEAGARTAC